MVTRLMANAAVHGIAGTVLGVTTVLAACTVAQAMRQVLKRDLRGRPDPKSAVSSGD